MFLKLYIRGLTQEEQYTLLKKIEIIQHHIYPELVVDYSYLKRHPNTISIDQEIHDEDKACELFRCLKSLDFKHEHDDYYEIYEDVEFDLDLSYHKVWDKVG